MRRSTRTSFLAGCAFVFLFPVVLSCYSADRGSGERALLEGRTDDAIAVLSGVVSANPKDGAAHLLLCRAYYAEELSKQALKECEAALANGAGGSSEAHDWMGRAYGAEANHAGAISGYSLAKKVKAEFERAVELDPGNPAAVNDLSEYYVGAPGFVGGGTDKAVTLAAKVQATLPQSAHRIRALVAQKSKDYAGAEREFKAAVAVGNKADAFVDLASFYQRRGQFDAAVVALHQATMADKSKDGSLLDIATIYQEMNRELPEAVRVVRTYLASPNKNDGSPAFRAHFVLGKLLAATGDRAGSQQEYRASLSMFANYASARKALESK